MKWSLLGSIGAALALSLAACSDRITTPAAQEGERSALMQRAQVLKAHVLESGKMSDAQRRELEILAQDIGAWQARTGRNDISVRRWTPVIDSAASSAQLAVVKQPNQGSCLPCPPVQVNGNQICFLSGGTTCGKPGDTLARFCWYVCIYDRTAPTTEPIR